jgi:DNA-binding beta-propeller fold protein YncE
MSKNLCLFIFLAISNCCRGALLADFSDSFALYQQLTTQPADFDGDGSISGADFLSWQHGFGRAGQLEGLQGDADRSGRVDAADLVRWTTQFGRRVPTISSSAAFKLYFDPQGIIEGAVTVVVDVPDPVPGQERFELDEENAVISRHPAYEVFQIGAPLITTVAGREVFKARVGFRAFNQQDPPAGPVTIFGYQVADEQSQFGFQNVQLGFFFETGDFITLFDPSNGQTITIGESSLGDAPLTLGVPLFLNVDPLTGDVSLANTSPAPIALTAYQITSAAGALQSTAWTSLDEGEGSDPPGVGWDEAGGSSNFALAESNITGSLTLNPGQTRSLGPAYNAGLGTQDLEFSFTTPSGAVILGVVKYTPTPVVPLPEPGGAALAAVSLFAIARRRRTSARCSERKVVAPAMTASRRPVGRLRLIAAAIVAVAAALLAGPQSAHAALYVTDVIQASVAKFNLNGTPVDTTLASVCCQPYGVAVSNDGANLFVANRHMATIGKYNATTGAPINESFITGFQSPVGIALSPDGTRVYVADDFANKIGVYNATTGAVINASLVTGLNSPDYVVATATHLFVANRNGTTVGKYTTAGATVSASFISGLSVPTGVAVSGDGQNLYVHDYLDFSSTRVGKYNAVTGAAVNANLITGLGISHQRGLAVLGSTVYATNNNGIGRYTTAGATVNASLITSMVTPHGLFATAAGEIPSPGDFNGDLEINLQDYLLLSANFLTDVSGLTPEQSYLLGDFTKDRRIDIYDFAQFRTAYDVVNGSGAFASMLRGVPEPPSAFLLWAAFLSGPLTGRFRLSSWRPSAYDRPPLRDKNL